MRKPEGQQITFGQDFLLGLTGYKVYTPEVLKMHRSNARLKIISAPARTSKSYSGAYDALADCFPTFLKDKDGKMWPFPGEKRIWIVAPNYSLAKEFDYLKSVLVDQRNKLGLVFYEIESLRTNADQGQLKIVMNFGKSWDETPVRTFIEVKSATNMQSIQADQADVVIMSEAADQDEVVWDKYISTRYGRAILPTTPKIKAEWLRKLINQGLDRPELKIETFWYDGRCNPTYDWERYWIEHAKAESRQSCPERYEVDFKALDLGSPPTNENGHDCFGKPDLCWAFKDPHFAEQYMGRWTHAEGRVLPFRTEDGGSVSHVLQTLPSWVELGRHYLSMDYGFDDESAVCWFSVGPDGTVVLYDSIYETGLTPADLARAVNGRQADVSYWKDNFGWERPPDLSFVAGDPKKPEVRQEFKRVGLNVISVDKKRQSSRELGFNVFRDYLSDDPRIGRPKFYIYEKTCKAIIDECRLLMRKPDSKDEYSTVGKDHGVDAIRYMLTVLPKGDIKVRKTDEQVERQIWLNQMMKQSNINGRTAIMGYR